MMSRIPCCLSVAIAFALIISPVSVEAGEKVAFVVGLNYDYDMAKLGELQKAKRVTDDHIKRVEKAKAELKLSPVDFCTNDAIDVAKELVSLGYEVHLFHDAPGMTADGKPAIVVNVEQLDASNQPKKGPDGKQLIISKSKPLPVNSKNEPIHEHLFPTANDFENTLEALHNEKLETVLFFFAGHGQVVGGRAEIECLPDITGINNDDDAWLSLKVSDRSLARFLEKTQASARVAILDSCRVHASSDEKTEPMPVVTDAKASPKQEETRIVEAKPEGYEPEDVWFLYATGIGDVANPDVSSQHGVMTKELLLGLQGYADGATPSMLYGNMVYGKRDGKVTLQELYLDLRYRMSGVGQKMNEKKKDGGKQKKDDGAKPVQVPRLYEPTTRSTDKNDLDIADYYRIDLRSLDLSSAAGKQSDSLQLLRKHLKIRSEFNGVHFDGATLTAETLTEEAVKNMRNQGLTIEWQVEDEPSTTKTPNLVPEIVWTKSTSKLTFRNVNFRGTSFQNSKITEIVFENCNFTGAVFQNAKLEKSKFIKCQFVGADFHGIIVDDIDATFQNNRSFASIEFPLNKDELPANKE